MSLNSLLNQIGAKRAASTNDGVDITNRPIVKSTPPTQPKVSVKPKDTFSNPNKAKQLERRRGAALDCYWGIWDYPTGITDYQKVRFIAGGFTEKEQTFEFMRKYDIPVTGKIMILEYYEYHIDETENSLNKFIGNE